jgi:hypothetical protein
MDRIPLNECIHGGLYRIDSRNLSIGVFDEKAQGYVGIREKFGARFLFTEYDWDTGPPFGTATPKEFLGMCPITDLAESHSTIDEEGDKIAKTNQPLFDWLDQKLKEIKDDE